MTKNLQNNHYNHQKNIVLQKSLIKAKISQKKTDKIICMILSALFFMIIIISIAMVYLYLTKNLSLDTFVFWLITITNNLILFVCVLLITLLRKIAYKIFLFNSKNIYYQSKLTSN